MGGVVFAEHALARRERSDAAAAPAITQPQGEIGRELKAARDALLEAVGPLADIVEPSARMLVTEAARLLEKQACRIGVVGQIKSGKSTFVNACAQSRSLLPTDVNPWTTAITNLHFLQRRGGDPVAMFRFFDEAEWRRLAEGGGLLRELTERLVPGFEPELLRQHVAALRHRAEARLGPQYRDLIGRSHAFEEISSEILSRYVCAGEGDGDAASGLPRSDIGRFADITRAADIHLDGGPFAFPVSLIDTPGTNDPFLLRDEITRRSLESADLYIVVLTARQPLGEADVALLRILKGLHKERIIVFINRIDDLADIATDLEEVTGFVRRRIAREFPDTEIPIIAGSARWAVEAMPGPDGKLMRAPDPRTLNHLVDKGYLRRESLVRAAGAGLGSEEIGKALLAASGLPEVHAAVSRIMATSHPALVIRQVASCYGEMAAASEAGARGELASLERLHAAARSTADSAVRQLETFDKELTELEQAATIIERSSQSIEAQMREIIAEEMGRLSEQLYGEIDRHAAEERAVLVDTLQRGRAPKEWTCEGLELRSRLAERYTGAYGRAAARLTDLRARVTPELNQLIGMIAPGERPNAPQARQRPEPPSPQLGALATYVALDLGSNWWAGFWSRRPTAEERGAEVEALIRQEFDAVADQLVAAGEQALGEYAGTVSAWSSAICRAIIDAIERRRASLTSLRQELLASVDGTADHSTLERQSAEIARLSDRLGRAVAASRLVAVAQTHLTTVGKSRTQ
ncbi:MAG: dynamin family protein [Hyphomicrobiaceae bacterium]|nr:dynamin family protein [Hyphomicrobiaceae bacterium]